MHIIKGALMGLLFGLIACLLIIGTKAVPNNKGLELSLLVFALLAGPAIGASNAITERQKEQELREAERREAEKKRLADEKAAEIFRKKHELEQIEKKRSEEAEAERQRIQEQNETEALLRSLLGASTARIQESLNDLRDELRKAEDGYDWKWIEKLKRQKKAVQDLL